MQTLIKFNNFVKELGADNSRLYKISVLEKYKDDKDIKYYLNFVFNPYITTGISDKSLKRFHSDRCIDTYLDNKFSTAFEALNYLKEHNTGDYKTLDLMFSYYMFLYLKDIERISIHLEEASTHQLFEKIIGKNIQLGIDAKTINKVIPNLIPTFNVQLANKYFEKPEIVEGKEFALTTKIDGCRIIAIKENGQVKFFTRQGQEYIGLVDLENEMKEFMPDNIALDGEITLLDKGDLDSGDQYKQTTKLCRTKDTEKHGLKMLVFDYMLSEDFKNQKCLWNYNTRREQLDVACSDIYNTSGELIHKFKYFQILPILYQGTDTSKIIEYLDSNVAKGEEGVMINIVDAPYEFKRSNSLLKVKKFCDTEVTVTGFEEGTNKNLGKLGALICDYKGNELKVGGGYSDEDREYIWNHKEEYLGKKITVKYFEETSNAEGGVSLRFPTYVGLRIDI